MTVRKVKKETTNHIVPPLVLTSIKPKTINQKKIFDYFYNGKNLFLHGAPGSGKSFCGIYLALHSIEKEEYDKLVIVRSIVPSREAGYLPGSIEEKQEVYEAPYVSIVGDLFKKNSAYKELKSKDKIKFISTSYLRGITIDNAIIIIDEVQNMNFMELHTIMTRVGENCRVIICGDEFQNDLENQREISCIKRLLNKIDYMTSFAKVEMGISDVQRSQIVKDWLYATMEVDKYSYARMDT